jgi:Flp pilus assembly CpaE family ATPase
LDSAEVVLAVGSADPVGLQRLIRGLATLREVVPAAEPQVVANRLRRGVVPGNPQREVARALQRFAGVNGNWTLPYDRDAADRSLAAGRTLSEVAEGAPLQRSLAELASRITGVSRPAHRLTASPVAPKAIQPVPAAAAWPVRSPRPKR